MGTETEVSKKVVEKSSEKTQNEEKNVEEAAKEVLYTVAGKSVEDFSKVS